MIYTHIQVEVQLVEGGAMNIHMFCQRKRGLLLSIMKALDNLGLQIHRADINCFDGFAMNILLAKVYIYISTIFAYKTGLY